MKQFAPNYTTAPKFEPHEIQSLFSSLCYPGSIRSDAITAVGAPSSIQYLMRAIYWLYWVCKVFFFEKQPAALAEGDNDDV